MTDGVGILGWSSCTLAECGEWVSGGTPRKSEPSYWGGDVPWISAKSAKVFDLCDSVDRLTAVGAATTKVVPKGTVLFVVRGMSLAREFRVGVAMRSLTLNQDLRAIIPSQHIDSRYLARFLRYSEPTILGKVEDSSHGTKRLPTDLIQALQVPLPPLPQQHRIAAILDKADVVRRKRRRTLQHVGAIIPSIFNSMFGDVVRNSRRWPTAEFGEICESRLGKMLDAKQQTGEHPRPYLRNKNVQWQQFNLNEVFEMDFNAKDREVFRLRRGDVLICEGGEVGRSAVWRDELPECYFQKALHRARPDPKRATPEFIVHLLRSFACEGGLKDHVTSATIAHLTGVKLKRMRIPVPPLGRQQEFTDAASQVERLDDDVKVSFRALDGLFASLVQRAFRGELTSGATVAAKAACDGSAAKVETAKLQERKSRPSVKVKKSTKTKRKQPQGINFKRCAIASYVIARLHDKPTFGRTQLEKLCYLTQTHLGIDLAMEFKREAAGPFDEVIHKVESLARKQGWFTTHKRKDFGHHYRPGPKIDSRVGAGETILGDQRESMDTLLDLFARMNTEQVELFATIYAVWNDLLLAGATPTDADIASELLNNWHESKKRFTTDRIQTCIDWIREQNMAPMGTGEATAK